MKNQRSIITFFCSGLFLFLLAHSVNVEMARQSHKEDFNQRNPASLRESCLSLARRFISAKPDDFLEKEFSDDFQKWLRNNGYQELLKSRVRWSSFGGKTQKGEQIERVPTLFIHGNSDTALGYAGHGLKSKGLTGWRKYYSAFQNKGIKESEIFGISWGDANPYMASMQAHTYDNIMRVRMAIEAVSLYSEEVLGNTGGRVNVVGHSMGVTLALKAIYGGKAYDAPVIALLQSRSILTHGFFRKSLELPSGRGGSLADRVENFVGIAGAAKGLDNCRGMGFIVPSCSDLVGLHSQSEVLKDIWSQNHAPAQNVYSLYSTQDELLTTSNNANRSQGVSSIVPYSQKEYVFDEQAGLDHFATKDENVELVWNLLYPE
jgi:hypothetical protein